MTFLLSKRILLIFFFPLLFSCKTSQYEMWASKKEMKDIYIDDFKLIYFKKLLIAGYNNTDEVKNMVRSDQSGFSEPILTTEDYELIDSLVTADNIRMTQDSIKRVGRVAEGSEGKHVFGYALNKYQSKWLDQLAKERFKIYWRKEKVSTINMLTHPKE
jgi:hypothetical protein